MRKLLLGLLLILQTFSFAQVKNIGLPDVINYKKNDYKGGTQNWNIGQDKCGNMYFANNNGLLQFDGSGWTTYKLPNSPAVRCLELAGDKIYVGGYNEFGYFAPGASGKLKYHSISKLLNPSSRKVIDFIWKIHTVKDEVIFQAFSRVYIYKNNRLTLLDAPDRFQFSFFVNGQLILQDAANGLLAYANGQLTKLKNTDALNGTEVWGIFALDKSDLLIATIDKGLFLYDGNEVTEWKTPAGAFMKMNNSLGGVMIKDRFLALNSVLDGEIICDKKGNIVQHINRKKGLQNNTVLSSFIDKSNNLWLGLDNGIAFADENSLLVSSALVMISVRYMQVLFMATTYM